MVAKNQFNDVFTLEWNVQGEAKLFLFYFLFA
jgi:hypothetical protein